MACKTTRKFIELDLKRKLEVLKDLSKGMTYREASEKYGISTDTAGNIWNKKKFYESRALANDSLDMKRCNRVHGGGAIIDERLHKWFMEV